MSTDQMLATIENYLQASLATDKHIVTRVPEGVLILVRGGPHVLIRANIASLVVT